MANRKRKKREGGILPIYINEESDKDLRNWWENETNGSAVVRMLIRHYIRTGVPLGMPGAVSQAMPLSAAPMDSGSEIKRDKFTEQVMSCIDNL